MTATFDTGQQQGYSKAHTGLNLLARIAPMLSFYVLQTQNSYKSRYLAKELMVKAQQVIKGLKKADAGYQKQKEISFADGYKLVPLP